MAEFQEMVNQLFNPRVAKSRKKTLFDTLDEWGLESLDPFAGANNKSKQQYDMDGYDLDAPNDVKREQVRRSTERLKAKKQSTVSRLMQDEEPTRYSLPEDSPLPTQSGDIPINKRELIPMETDERPRVAGERPRIVGQEPEPTVKPRSKVADKLRAIQNAPVKDYSKYKKVKDAMGDVVLNDDGTPVLETDAEGKPVKKSQWKRFAQGFKNFVAAMGEGQGMGAALLTATTDPTFDERREKQTAFNTMLQKYQVEQQIENDQLNEDVKVAQMRNMEADNELARETLKERQLTRKPVIRQVAGVTYQYNYETSRFEPANIPVDKSQAITEFTVELNGERHTYSVPQKDAAKFASQMQIQGARILAQKEMQADRIEAQKKMQSERLRGSMERTELTEAGKAERAQWAINARAAAEAAKKNPTPENIQKVKDARDEGIKNKWIQ